MNNYNHDQLDIAVQEIRNKSTENANERVENSSDEENYSYSDESLCSDDSINKSDITNVTTRSSVTSRSSFLYSSASKSSNSSGENKMIKNRMEKKKKNYLLSSLSSATNQINVNTTRKNMSFTNSELMKIERENQYLLRKIMEKSTSKSIPIQATLSRPSSSAINRKRLQRKIEEENMMMLRRIQNAKPHISVVKRAPKHQFESLL